MQVHMCTGSDDCCTNDKEITSRIMSMLFCRSRSHIKLQSGGRFEIVPTWMILGRDAITVLGDLPSRDVKRVCWQ